MRGPKVQDQHKLLLKTQIKLQRSISVTGYRESHLRTTCLLPVSCLPALPTEEL